MIQVIDTSLVVVKFVLCIVLIIYAIYLLKQGFDK